jgi:two-component system, chemotaxis family, sensor kinase CheA
MQFEPELLQDFLTESGELLEQLDKDLVRLEATPTDLELVNQVFRALHTIKGSASFLALTNLVKIAHAAETALNAARNRVFVIDRGAMDLLLSTVDVVKRQFENLRAGEEMVAAEQGLVDGLIGLAEGRKVAAAVGAGVVSAGAKSEQDSQTGVQQVQGNVAARSGGQTGGADRDISFPPGKAELVEFLVADVEATLTQVEGQLARLIDDAQRVHAAGQVSELSDALLRSVDFFQVEPMIRLAETLKRVGSKGGTLNHESADLTIKPTLAVASTLREIAQGLNKGRLLSRPVEAIVESVEAALEGRISSAVSASHEVVEAEAGHGVIVEQRMVQGSNGEAGEGAKHASAAGASGGATTGAASTGGGGHGSVSPGDQTIRVEVKRLEALLNLVGELVLQKNRMGAIGRQIIAEHHATQEFREVVTQANSALDRVTSDLQVAVMKTRMQPLEKLFGKYPRLIRDLARKLNKNINLVIEGGETEVDKSVIEELGDPLVHLMRNSCDHGIEMPGDRAGTGKPEMGTIKLSASHQGSHVEILIIDDGKGIHPGFISKKAIEKGVVTEAQVAAMSDREKMGLIFAPGFSTAEKISDVSGRGVGMDVVKTNIEKLKGTIEIESVVGQGTTMRIKIPLTVAIMTAMMVGVGAEIYAVPLTSITEIVKPDSAEVSTIRGHKVMRLRDTVLPLIDGTGVFTLPGENRPECPFAVVLAAGEKRVGLMVSRLIGQQEIVIKPLDQAVDHKGPISGATVRDDGGVSLIVDVGKLFAMADSKSS